MARPLARLIAPDAIRRLEQLNDWAQLGIYHLENQALMSSPSDPNRVVFLGDSIIEFWSLATAFPGKPYINRGIAGQTTPQLLVRFRPDAIALQPRVVLILAGTNDIAGNTGPMTLDMIIGNYASMAELARAHAIPVIFASVLPLHDYGTVTQSKFRSPAKIQALNTWLKDYCAQSQQIYLDYYHALIDAQGMLRAELADDGIHPNAQGYAVMTAMTQNAIDQVIGNAND